MSVFEKIETVLDEMRAINGGSLGATLNATDATAKAKAIITSYGKLHQLCGTAGIEIPVVNFAVDTEKFCDSALRAARSIELRVTFEVGKNLAKEEHARSLVALSVEQIEDIEGHIQNARQLLRASNAFDDRHKRRLLSRLEKVQSEIHKKVSDMDVILAGVTEVTAVAGESAKNLNPVADLFKKILGIANDASEEPLALPSPPKQIEDHSSEDE